MSIDFGVRLIRGSKCVSKGDNSPMAINSTACQLCFNIYRYYLGTRRLVGKIKNRKPLYLNNLRHLKIKVEVPGYNRPRREKLFYFNSLAKIPSSSTLFRLSTCYTTLSHVIQLFHFPWALFGHCLFLRLSFLPAYS